MERQGTSLGSLYLPDSSAADVLGCLFYHASHEVSDLSVNLVKPGTATGRVFVKNLRRAQVLVDFFDKDAEARQHPTKASVELLRSALVFTVGALDTYLHDLILEIVPKCKQPYSEDLLGLFKAIAKKDSALAFRLLDIEDKFARRREFIEVLEKSLSTGSFLTPARLNQALEYINCRIDWQDFDQVTGCDTTEQLSLIAQQRNDILHRGWVATITRGEVNAAITLVGIVGRSIDDRVCKKYGIPSMQ